MKSGDVRAEVVDRDNAVPLYHQIFVQLREEILSGQRGGGSRLPTEPALATLFGVSRVTARRALAELAGTGLVARKRRVGTTVIFEPPALPIEGSIDQAVEALLAFGRATQVRLLALGEIAAAPPVSDALGVIAGTPVIRVVRLRCLDGVPLGHLVSVVPLDVGEHITRAALRTNQVVALIERSGVVIGAMRQTVSASAADPALAAVLEVETGAPMLRISRTIVDDGGRAVQHIVAHYRPDRCAIRFE